MRTLWSTLALAVCLAVSGYAVSRAFLAGHAVALVGWFVGALVAHDLVLLPLYALADALILRLPRLRPTRRLTRQSATRQSPTWRPDRERPDRERPDRRRRQAADAAWVNHIRVPAILSGTLLLAWFPLIAGLSRRYGGVTARDPDVYLDRWALVTALLFGASALLAALRSYARRRGRHRRRP